MKLLHCLPVALALMCLGCEIAPPDRSFSWDARRTNCAASLRGLAAVDRNVAFVGGSQGTLLHTMDGGKTWRDIAPPDCEGCDFRDVEALDERRVVAMVAGQPARVYRTDDAGDTWQLVHQDARPAAFFDAMAFAGDHGFLFGDAMDGQFCLLASDDGGCTWTDVSGRYLPVPEKGEAAFAASGTCLAVADNAGGTFSLVTGGGPARFALWGRQLSQSYVDLPMQHGTASRGAFSIAWNGSSAVVVGGDYAEPSVTEKTAAVTTDGGQSWVVADAGGYRSAALWLGDNSLLAVGSHGASLSFDGGRTWTVFGDEGFHSLSKGLDGSIWACGSDGRVARLCVAE
jgi:photosystem II stability/assembly factor-like uncharacterized protein